MQAVGADSNLGSAREDEFQARISSLTHVQMSVAHDNNLQKYGFKSVDLKQQAVFIHVG